MYPINVPEDIPATSHGSIQKKSNSFYWKKGNIFSRHDKFYCVRNQIQSRQSTGHDSVQNEEQMNHTRKRTRITQNRPKRQSTLKLMSSQPHNYK